MWKVTRKGLAGAQAPLRAHGARRHPRRRRSSRARSCSPATIQKTFDDLFANINRGTDAAVRVRERASRATSATVSGQRARRRSSTVVRQTPSVEAADGNIQAPTRRSSTATARRSAGTARRPSASAGTRTRSSTSSTSSPAIRRQTDDQIVDRQTDRRQGPLQGRRPGHRAHHEGAAEVSSSSASRSSEPSTASRARRSRCSPLPEVQRARERRRTSSRRSRSWPSPASSQDAGRQRHPHDAGRATARSSTRSSPARRSPRRTRTRSTRRSASSAPRCWCSRSSRSSSACSSSTTRSRSSSRNACARWRCCARSARSRRQVLALGDRRVGRWSASSRARSAWWRESGLSIGLKARHERGRIRDPGQWRRAARRTRSIIGLLVGTIVTILSAIVPARQAARVPPIAAMRSGRARAPDQPSSGGVAIGGVDPRPRARCCCSSACSATAGSRSSGIGALLMLVGVFVLVPLFARQLARAHRRAAHEAAGHRRQPVARERGPEPAAHRHDGRGRDDRGVARRVHHDLRGVGERVDRLRDRPAAQDRLHRHRQGRRRSRGARRHQPRARRSRSQALPEIQDVYADPARGRVGSTGSRTFLAAADPTAGRRSSTTSACVAGSVADLDARTAIAVSTRKADSKHLKIGSILPAKFVKTGNRCRCKVEFIYKNNAFAGDYVISLATYEQNFAAAARRADLRQAEARGDARPRAAPRSSRWWSRTRTRSCKDNAQYKADQKKQVNQVLGARLRAAVPRGDHRVHRDRQHDDALDLRAHAARSGCFRAVGGSRRQVRSMVRWEAVIIALVRHRCSASRWRCSSGGRSSTRCTTRASPSSRPRPRQLVFIVVFTGARHVALGEPARPARGEARRAEGDRAGVAATDPGTSEPRLRLVAELRVLVAHLLREIGLVALHRGAQLLVAGCRGCAPRAGRRCGRCRSRRWRPECRPASARSTAGSRGRRAASAAPARRSRAAGSSTRSCPGGARRRPRPR